MEAHCASSGSDSRDSQGAPPSGGAQRGQGGRACRSFWQRYSGRGLSAVMPRWLRSRYARQRPPARRHAWTLEVRRRMSAGCVASRSSVALVDTSRAPGPTSATCACMTSAWRTSVLNARWLLVEGPPPSLPHPARSVSTACLAAGCLRMPQGYICIDCGRSVDRVARGRCGSCLPAADKERHAKYGDRTGRMTPARRQHQAFITSPEWRRLRKKVIARDGHQCTSCGSTKDLTAHHLVPVRVDPSLALDMDNCITLCRPCHGRAEGGRGQW